MLSERQKLYRFTFNAEPEKGTQLETLRAFPRWAALLMAVMFAVFAWVWLYQFSRLFLDDSGSMFDLMSWLVSLFWLLGWSVVVLFLAMILVYLLFFRESAWISGRHLVILQQVGRLGYQAEYELVRVHNPRVVVDGRNRKSTMVRFEYDGLSRTLGSMLPREVSEHNLKLLLEAMGDGAFAAAEAPFVPVAAPQAQSYVPPRQDGLSWLSMLALIGANLIPLFMVLQGGWSLEQVIVLFWAESAVIGCYTLLKMAVVAKWWTIFIGVLFLGHFGGFMAGHFMFIDMLFLHGEHVGNISPAALLALKEVFAPLVFSLLALAVSHGVSFVMNFIGRREFEAAKVSSLMIEPYGRIMVMQITLIFGGWVVILLHDPKPVLALLVVIKILADLRNS